MAQNNLSFTLRVLIGIATLGLAMVFMKLAAGFIVPVLLALIIVLSASPMYYWLQERKAPGWLAFVLTLLAIVLVLGSLVVVLVVAVERLHDLLPTYEDKIDDFRLAIKDFLIGLGLGTANASDTVQQIDPEKITSLLAALLTAVAGAFSNIVLVIMAIIFMLIEVSSMPTKLAHELELGNEYVKRLSDFSVDIRRYISITTWIGLLTGFVDTIFFVIIGIPLPLLWGLLAFLLSYIPVIGFWLAAIPPTILALLEYGPVAAIIVFLGIVLINGAADEILKPKFMGEGLDLSPFMVIFSVTIWSAVLGPLGAILGVPVTMTIKELILEADEQNAWIARLMGKAKKSTPDDDETVQPSTVSSQE